MELKKILEDCSVEDAKRYSSSDLETIKASFAEEYTRGWNNAIHAVLETMIAHPIDWMGDRAFGDMEREQKDAIARLLRPEGEAQ